MLFFLEFSITERNEYFYFLSLVDLFHLILAWNEATMVFFLFFSLFLEFCISHQVGTERKYNFYFRSFSSFSNLYGCKRSHNGVFLFFEFFYNFFWIISYASCRNETKRLFLFSLFFGLFQPVLAWNEAVMVFLNF